MPDLCTCSDHDHRPDIAPFSECLDCGCFWAPPPADTGPLDPIDREAIHIDGYGAITMVSASQCRIFRDEAFEAGLVVGAAEPFESADVALRAACDFIRRHVGGKTSGPGHASPGPVEEEDGGGVEDGAAETPVAAPASAQTSAGSTEELGVRGSGDGAEAATSVAPAPAPSPASLGPAALELAELIDREWIASCLAQTGENPGAPAVRAMADPLNGGIVDAAYTELRGVDVR